MKVARFFRQVFVLKEMSSILMLIATIVVFRILSPAFLSFYNVRTLLELFPEFGIVVLGVAMLMISGEFDLSIGSVFALCPIVIVDLIRGGVNIGFAVTVAFLICIAIGAINAIMVVKTGIPSFIITLATMMIWRGTVLAVTEGTPPPIPKTFEAMEKYIVGWVGPIRISFIYFIIGLVILWVLLERTRFGNWIFATGGNKEAARARGINPSFVKLLLFVLTSFLAGFAGLVQTARIGSALPSAGKGWELDAIAASVIGGISLFGGVGSIIGATIGAFLLRAIGNGLVLAGAPGYYFRMFVGFIIIIAVLFDIAIKRRAAKFRF